MRRHASGRWICTARLLLSALLGVYGCGGGGGSANVEPTYVSGEVGVIPRPAAVEVDAAGSSFVLGERTRILVADDSPEVGAVAAHLADLLQPHSLAVAAVAERRGTQPTDSILLAIDDSHPNPLDGAYTLSVTSQRIAVRAADALGLFYGVQSLRQLLPSEIEDPSATPPATWSVPSVRLEDAPRFPWRGLMIDVSRAFFPKEMLLRYVDLLALFKMNKLHLHLTDDQGWRVEIDSHPDLHELGSRFPSASERSGYYTQEDLRQIVAYAHSRHVEVVPEIDMPGHALAALHALPHLACTTTPEQVRTAEEFPIHLWSDGPFIQTEILCACDERVYQVLEDVLSEVIEIFPSRYVHLGGDEVPTREWESSYLCAQWIDSGEITDVDQVQAYFTKRMEDFLLSRGKVLLAWDEVHSKELAGDASTRLSDSATIMHWRDYLADPPGLYDRDVVQTPFTSLYLDYRSRPLEQTYLYEPIPDGLSAEQQAHVLGAQGNMWTGFPQGRSEERVDLHVFPKLLAIAEITWSPRQQRDFADFERRREIQTPRLDLLGVRRGECADCVL